jgi:hypothetical protein
MEKLIYFLSRSSDMPGSAVGRAVLCEFVPKLKSKMNDYFLA